MIKHLVTGALLALVTIVGSNIPSRAAGLPDFAREAEDVAAQRDTYYAIRRINPYDSNFDSAAARYQAFQNFSQVIANMRRATAASPANQVHFEVWQPIGPAPIALGQTPTTATDTTRSPVAGRVSALAIDAIDNAVYAGGAQGGVWRTLDNGATWVALTDYLGSLAIGTITIEPGSHPVNQGTVYLGTGESNLSADSYGGVGIYKSINSGQTWQGPYGQAQFANRGVSTIAVDTANASHLIAGSSSGIFGTSGVGALTLPTRGIYISNDGGQTWTISASALAQARVSRIVQDPTTPTTWWAGMTLVGGSGGALLKSTDNGVTWSAVDGVATGLPAINGTGVGGLTRTWLSLVTSGGSTVLYFGAGIVTSGSNGGTLYVSTDGGTTWARKTASNGFCQAQCWYDMPVYAVPESPTTVFTGGAGNSGSLPSSFMRSTNGGTSFVDRMVGIDGDSAIHADIHAITSWPGQPANIWVGNDGGVFHSSDSGDHWISANSNLQLTQFETCDLHPTDPNQAYGGTQDNGTDSYLGSSTNAWSHSDDGDGGFALIDQIDPSQVTHTYYNQSNNLIGATVASNGPASSPDDYVAFVGSYPGGGVSNGIVASNPVLFYAPMHLDRGVHDTLYFGTDHLYIAPSFFSNAQAATNTSTVFTLMNGGASLGAAIPPSSSAGEISAIESVANIVPSLNATTLLLGTSNGHVWRSTNSGATFTDTDTTPSPIAQYVSKIIANPRNPNIVFQARAGFTGSVPAHNVRVSTDGGTTWADASNGLPDIPVNALAFDPVFDEQIWAGTDIGMYLSTDRGTTWVPYNQGIPNVAIFDVKANRQTHTILACTHGRGAFRLNLDAIFIDGFETP